jgi:hypothetical protein
VSTACEQTLDLLSDVVLDLVRHGPRDRAGIVRARESNALFPHWLRILLGHDDGPLDRALRHGRDAGLLIVEGDRYRATPEGRAWAEERGRAEDVELLCADASHAVDAAQLCVELAARGPLSPEEAASVLHPMGPFEAMAGIADEPRRERVEHSIHAAVERGWVERSDGRLRLTEWGRREAESLLQVWR